MDIQKLMKLVALLDGISNETIENKVLLITGISGATKEEAMELLNHWDIVKKSLESLKEV